MKKQVLFLVVFCINFLAIGQKSELPEIPMIDGKIIYERVISIEGNPKEIQSYATKFIAERYRNAKDVIQLNDIEGGVIIAKGTFEVVSMLGAKENSPMAETVGSQLKFEFKEGRIKVTISDFEDINQLRGFERTPIEKRYIELLEKMSNEKPKRMDLWLVDWYSKYFIQLDLKVLDIFSDIESYIKEQNNSDW